MNYILALIFIVLYLIMGRILPLKASYGSTWDPLLEPVIENSVCPGQDADGSVTYTETYFLEQIKTLCVKHFNLEGTLKLKSLQEQSTLSLNSEQSVALKIINFPKRLKPITYFCVQVMVDDQLYMQIDHWPVQVKLMQSCLRARRNLLPNVTLSTQDFDCIEKNVLTLPFTPVQDINRVTSFKLKHLLKKAEILGEEALEMAFTVLKGQTVDVKVNRGLLSMQLKGVAMENGRLDQLITIKNISTNKTFQGKIVSDGTVQVVQ